MSNFPQLTITAQFNSENDNGGQTRNKLVRLDEFQIFTQGLIAKYQETLLPVEQCELHAYFKSLSSPANPKSHLDILKETPTDAFFDPVKEKGSDDFTLYMNRDAFETQKSIETAGAPLMVREIWALAETAFNACADHSAYQDYLLPVANLRHQAAGPKR
jgi:hypothetical protein